jgi:hypothetical protein
MRTEPRARAALLALSLALGLVVVLAAVLGAAATAAGLLTGGGLWLGMFAVGGGCATVAMVAIRRWSGDD